MPTDSRFRIEWPALVRDLVPALLRRPTTLAWLEALTSPVASLYEQLLTYRVDVLRQLSYNGQTILLEKALNDTFDPAFRRIRIVNAVGEITPLYLNFVREQQPMPTAYFTQEPDYVPLYVYRQVEFNTQLDFTVYAPGQAGRAVALHTLIRRLKRAMTNYQILYTSAPN